MSLLQVEALGVSIGGQRLVEDVSLRVDRGEILGVIGESGSGKSLTALSVMQLLPQDAACTGRIKLDGEDLIGLPEPRLCGLRGRAMGMVFQEPMTALNPLHTIGQQVAETILIHENVSRDEARRGAEQALTRVEMPPDRVPLSRYPHELSGGQRQRVGIAMAIALSPKLLIADEPTTALDVTTQAEVLRLLKRLVSEDGMGLVLISHDLGVVADMADRLVIMQKGRVVEEGRFGTLTHPYSRKLIAASSHVPERHGGVAETPLLQVQDVVRSYPGKRAGLFGRTVPLIAVDGVSFDIRQGENLGLVGESGCGKSTLSRAILGLEPVDTGQILLDGHPVFDAGRANHSIRRRMQAVFQDPYGSFNPRHKVDRLVAEPFHLLANAPRGADRTRAICEALESVGLAAEDRHKYIHEFSGGQRQRIAIARALIIKPELIILDEAVSALDVSIRAQILDLLAALSKRFGLTYLFISHDLSVVRNVTDRVLVMQAGKIVEEGQTEQVFQSPRHPYTQRLIAASPRLPENA